MEERDYWQMLKSLPQEVIKESGKYTGHYTLSIESFDGIYSLEYVMPSFSEDLTFPFNCTGKSLEEVVEKACKFFDDNFGKYKLVKY